MSERKDAVINVSKGLLNVSLSTVATVAGAMGNVPVAGAATFAQATLASDILKPLLEKKQEEHINLPLPRWWTREPQLQSWQTVCTSIEGNLSAILKGVEGSLRQETSYPSSEVVKRLFIEQTARHLSSWEVGGQDCYMVATYVTPYLLEKTSGVLKAAIDTVQQDALAQWLTQIVTRLDAIQQAEITPPAVQSATPASQATQEAATTQDIQAIALKLEQKLQKEAYDVYICYDDEDEDKVMKIGEQLKRKGILPWFDGVDRRPGKLRKQLQEEQIVNVPAAAVFIGQHAIERGQLLQIYAFIQQYIDRECSVIPVLLSDAPAKPTLPSFLAEFGWVDFRKPVPDPLKQLIWGITGERP